MVTLDKIPFSDIKIGMRCRSLPTNTKGTLTKFRENYRENSNDQEGFFTIEWDNGSVSVNTIFCDGPWAGQNIEVLNG
jgi:hypothetical protein